MLPRLVIWSRKVVLDSACSVEIWILFTVCLHSQNRGLSAMSSFRVAGNCFCLEAIRRWKNCFTRVNEEAAKACAVDSKTSKAMWEQSSRHGFLGMSKMWNSLLPPLLATMRHPQAAANAITNLKTYTSFSQRSLTDTEAPARFRPKYEIPQKVRQGGEWMNCYPRGLKTEVASAACKRKWVRA